MAGLSKVALFTNEYPPNVYGGAGVHVEYLSRELARLVPVEVRCFGDQDVQAENLRVKGYGAWAEAKQGTDPRFGGALDAFYRNLHMAKDTLDASVVHCHTWYADMAGVLAKKLWGVPLVLTIHSLEPLRPWKVEQLGNAYHLSSWMERTGIEDADAVVAVSEETRNDVLRFFKIAPEKVPVIHNGIDLQQYRKNPATDALTTGPTSSILASSSSVAAAIASAEPKAAARTAAIRVPTWRIPSAKRSRASPAALLSSSCWTRFAADLSPIRSISTSCASSSL